MPECQIVDGNGMVMVCGAVLVLERRKWDCLRKDKLKCGTPYAASEVVALLVGELLKWECLTSLESEKKMARMYRGRWWHCRLPP